MITQGEFEQVKAEALSLSDDVLERENWIYKNLYKGNQRKFTRDQRLEIIHIVNKIGQYAMEDDGA
jgi:hypothetical protein